jgi:trans-2,3-dihydro-3-hydroxyanthranilate isomerase
MAFEPHADGERMIVIEQGVEMGRPSRIALGLEAAGGALTGATIGGATVLVAEGTIEA